jgi:hypothetical protein
LNAFPAARYRLDFEVVTPLRLPDYAGSALRGAFGHALKRSVCVTRAPDCKTCALYRSCAYPAVFAPPAPEHHAAQKFSDIPAPYVIEPPPWGARAYAAGETLTFHLVLIGGALRHLPLIVHALTRAFDSGIGTGDGRARLVGVGHLASDTAPTPILDTPSGRLLDHPAVLPAPPSAATQRIALEFDTPLRLQHNGRPLRAAELVPARLLMGLVKRTALLAELHAGQPLELDFRALAQHAETIDGEKSLNWRDWGRYSSRQQREMKLGGVVGRWTLTGELAPFWPFLHLGLWLHVGKETTFGLGKYRLTQPA